MVTEISDTVARVERKRWVSQPKGNRIEGFATKRMYTLLGKDRSFWKLPIHRNVLPFPQRLMEPGAILSGTTCMHIGPGEVHQGLHSDDGLVDQIDVPTAAAALHGHHHLGVHRLHMPRMAQHAWCLGRTASTTSPSRGRSLSTSLSEMPAGSVLIVNGGTWHCGGANTSDHDWRLGISVQYCRGWMRQQQNQYYSLSPDRRPRHA